MLAMQVRGDLAFDETRCEAALDFFGDDETALAV